MARCGSCQFVRTFDQAHAPDDFSSDAEPGRQRCPDCDVSDEVKPGFSVNLVAVPLAFRTRLGLGADAIEDWSAGMSGASSVAETQGTPHVVLEGGNTTLSMTAQGRVFRVNDRRGEGFRGRIGTTGGKHALEHQWIDERYQDDRRIDFKPQGPVEEIALVAPKTTDVLRVRPSELPSGLRLAPTSIDSAARGALYSAAFLLREAISDLIDIEPDEIELANVVQSQVEGQRMGELVLSDHLPNGAGFVRWARDNWYRLLQSLTSPLASDSFGGEILAHKHREHCATAGYDCLYNYRNMPYHGLLDWRLGISVLRILESDSYRCGLDGDFSAPELDNWDVQADRLAHQFASVFDLQRESFGPLQGFYISNRPVVVAHPLWAQAGPEVQGLLKTAVMTAGPTVLKIDTFNLQRRQTWCYQRLLELANEQGQ